MVLATEKAAAELCRTWQVATSVLAVPLSVVRGDAAGKLRDADAVGTAMKGV